MEEHFKKQKFIEAFKKLNYPFRGSKLAVLDLGCENTLNLSFLFHFSEFKELSAVDHELITHSDYTDQDKIICDDLSYIDDYSYTDALEFLNSNAKNFDLIILSNFLHLFQKIKGKEILTKCFERLKPNGIIYILIANKEHKGWEEKSNENKYKNPMDYAGPQWGMSIGELADFIKPLKIIYSNELEHHIEIFCQS